MEYNVMLVEGNRLVLEQLANVIRNTEGFQLAARYQDPMDALGQGAVFKPNLILLDVEQGNGMDLLKEFLQAFPNVPVICLGDHWQSEVASRMVQEGARGYLVKPFTSEELSEAVDTFGKSGMEVASQMIAFFSPKGKSGKTTLIANLAMSLAQKSGAPVGIIDADLQFGDMSVFFNLEPQSTIVEAVRDVDFLSPISLNNYFLPVTDKVKVLCGTKNPSLNDKVEISPLEKMVN
ncbi:MAG TPA: response regulator receiver protein, partial [Selenomonas sp.]|nr:response regulator receiver protein [Selenomonas sp.]